MHHFLDSARFLSKGSVCIFTLEPAMQIECLFLVSFGFGFAMLEIRARAYSILGKSSVKATFLAPLVRSLIV